MKKIVLGIVVMAVLLGGLGVGFVAGYEYKCMEEEQDLALINQHIECQCYYAGDIDSFGWCLDECVDNKLDELGEHLIAKYLNVIPCDKQDWTCEDIQREIEKAENCAYCNMIANYHEIDTHEEAERIASEIIMSYEEGGRFYIADMTPEDMGYWKAKAFCED